MARAISLPVTPAKPRPHRLPRIVRSPRPGPALQPTALTADPEVLGLDLTRGCLHRCVFCWVRGQPSHGNDDELSVYDDTTARLAAELDARPGLPRAVFISPAGDAFPPIAEVQEEAARAITVLADRGVESWLMTRGLIRPPALTVLETHRLRVRVTVSLTTCDRALQLLLEPWTASPRLRLKQIAALRQRGIPVHVAIDPLIPGVTDTRQNLAAVLAAVAETGVRHVTASYAFLREGIENAVCEALAPRGQSEPLVAAFADGPLLTAPGPGTARYLPRARRQRGYGMLIALAAAHGITVSFCGMTNPDFGRTRPRAASTSAGRRLPLFAKNK